MMSKRVTLTGLSVAVTMFAASPSHTDPGGCTAATITGESQAKPSGAFVGSGTLELGQTIEPIDRVSVITSVVANPDGHYVFSSHLALATGAGRIHSGFLDVIGRVDLIAGHVQIDSSQGSLCAAR
jgi:hypothetical protein